MRCPECIEGGVKSRVFTNGSSTTLMGHSPYYDEDGRYHNHDPNIRQSSYRCSNGHAWSQEDTHTCWCGWSNNAENGVSFPLSEKVEIQS